MTERRRPRLVPGAPPALSWVGAPPSSYALSMPITRDDRETLPASVAPVPPVHPIQPGPSAVPSARRVQSRGNR
ncbi:hypothetical protein ACFFX0_08145 [Citricoccus parietis]|uniref:Uncharacterized protein n=1 Tax=Citricoccus parietis TaxID=592307 RepID=A0ABV5FWX5_9MICC